MTNCKYCLSENTIKFGTHTDAEGNEIQRYFCKDCKRKFVPDTIPIPFNNWLDVVKSTTTEKPQTPHTEETSSSFFDYSQLSPEQQKKHLHRIVARKAQVRYTAKKKANRTGTPQVSTIRIYQKRKQP